MKITYSIVEFIAKGLRKRRWTRELFYNPIKNTVRRRVGTFNYMLHYLDRNREIAESLPDAFGDPVVGIMKDPFHFHAPYMVACKELKVGYRIVDIFAEDWISRIKESGCKTFLAWPGESIAEWKKLYDDRLRFIVEHMGFRIYPDLTACWLYGSKERQSAWLEVNGIPHPRTWVFYMGREAMRFADEYDFQHKALIGKTDIGAVASGVRIISDRHSARKYIRMAFTKGTPGYYADAEARQWRHVLLQEYLQDVKEWRVIRFGESFFGFGKLKKGNFHSGSHEFVHVVPPEGALNLAWAITERGQFRSMAVDIFETSDGRFLVNELQCVFGQHSSDILFKDGVSGRLLRNSGGKWMFESGTFAGCHGCLLRVKDALGLAEM